MEKRKKTKNEFMAEAIRLSQKMMQAGKGGPFGAIIIKNGRIISRGFNQVTSANDPTAHAEITAIRAACKTLKTFWLTGCELYTSCEPCPMCLAAIYWAKLKKVYYANTKKDAARIGFADNFIYQELEKPLAKRKLRFEQLMRRGALKIFKEWKRKNNKIKY